MSAPLIPNLFAVCKVLIAAIIGIVQSIIYALSGPIPPLRGLGDWLGLDAVITVVTYLIVVTVVVLWVTVLNLFTVMWVERKLYSRLQDRYGIMISIWSLPFWPFNRVHRPTHKGLGYLQNLADGVKLIQKENITPRNADSAMFHISPVLIASSTLMVFAVLPWSSGFYVANLDLGILFILAAFSLAPLGILIAGYAANNKYTLVGGFRAAAGSPFKVAGLLGNVTAADLNGDGKVDLVAPFYDQNTKRWLVAILLADQRQRLGHLGHADKPNIRPPEPGVGNRRAGHVERLESRLCGDQRGERVIDARRHHDGLLGEAGAQVSAPSHDPSHRPFPCRGPVFATLSVGGIPVPIVPEEIWFLLRVYLLAAFFVVLSWSVPRVRIDQILNIGWKRLIPYSLLAILVAAGFRVLG